MPTLADQEDWGDQRGDRGGTCMPTLADREDWDEGFASRLASWMARQEECGGWDEDDDWLDDWEERREETWRGFAEQGQRKGAWGQW